MMRDLIGKIFHAAFGKPEGAARDAAAVAAPEGGTLAFTTDSYVVRPRVFPGGDIGRLAVHGTVNDLAMAGARPLALSAGFIIEEGLPMGDLWKVVCSMAAAARDAGVAVVTGDTKVVERGMADGVYINTAGVGSVPQGRDVRAEAIRTGDAIVVSGDVGRHGMAVMSVREGLEFATVIESDCAALNGMVEALYEAGLTPHMLRDLTRGGLNAALNELVMDTGLSMEVVEKTLPVDAAVRAACEILGLEPLQVACEGRMVVILPTGQADRAVEVMRGFPGGEAAAVVGGVGGAAEAPRLTLRTTLGTRRILDLPPGEQLPRIC